MKVNKTTELEGGWIEVPFKFMAENISNRVDPKKTELETYIGLEHIDPWRLKIKRVGKPDEVKGIKLIAQPGDIIFGKRRAYQGKIGICEWDAIVSAHSMVLRETVNIEENFLKFFMQTNEFYNRSIQISEGSLSPTIKWKVLSEQMFKIPPKELQHKIVTEIELIENFINKKEELISKIYIFKQKLMNEMFTNGLNKENKKECYMGQIPQSWEVMKIKDVAKVVTGKTPSTKRKDFYGEKYPWVTPSDIKEDIEICVTERQLSEIGFNSSNAKLPVNSVLVTCIASIGKNAILKKIGSCNQQINALLPNPKYIPQFMYYWINQNVDNLVKHASKTTIPILNKTTFENIDIALPPIDEQRRIASVLEKLDELIKDTNSTINESHRLKKVLLNDYFK